MAGINMVLLLGNLGKDPEVKTLENGTKVAKFSVATSETYRDKISGEKKTLTEWHNVEVWKSLAEIAEKYLTKGSQVHIQGKNRTTSYLDKDGKTIYTTKIVGTSLTMIGSNSKNSNSEAIQPESNLETHTADNEDDLPF